MANYRAGLTVKGGDEATRVVKMKFGREVPGADMDGARYAVLEERDTVYVVPGWSFRQLFPKGKTLFRLPGLKLKKEDVQEIALYSPDGTVRMSRAAEGPGAAPAGEGGETPPVWQVDEPTLGFPGETGRGGRPGRVSVQIRTGRPGAGKWRHGPCGRIRTAGGNHHERRLAPPDSPVF